jgi:hypothetical protein
MACLAFVGAVACLGGCNVFPLFALVGVKACLGGAMAYHNTSKRATMLLNFLTKSLPLHL